MGGQLQVTKPGKEHCDSVDSLRSGYEARMAEEGNCCGCGAKARNLRFTCKVCNRGYCDDGSCFENRGDLGCHCPGGIRPFGSQAVAGSGGDQKDGSSGGSGESSSSSGDSDDDSSSGGEAAEGKGDGTAEGQEPGEVDDDSLSGGDSFVASGESASEGQDENGSAEESEGEEEGGAKVKRVKRASKGKNGEEEYVERQQPARRLTRLRRGASVEKDKKGGNNSAYSNIK